MSNVLTAYTPEFWAMESLAILRERVVIPRLVRRDFTRELASAGDTVNTRKPRKMTAQTVDPVTGVSPQDAISDNVAVTLDQHKHVTFRISDVDASKSFRNLVEEFLDPAMLALANAVDTSLLGLYSDVTTTVAAASAGGWKGYFNDARTKLNVNLVPDADRFAILSDEDEGNVSNLDILNKVNEAGTSETLRNGMIGRLKGFDIFRSSNVIEVGSDPTERMNIFFERNAFALVTRVLRTAAGVTPGAIQTVAVDPDGGLSLRMTMSYNATLLATQVTLDILYGVKTLDEKRSVIVESVVP